MADQTERIIIEIDGSSVKGEAQQVERAINTIGDAADKAGKKVTTAEKGISELGGALKTTGSSAKVTEREFNALQTSIGKTHPTLAQADALKQVANSAKQSASEMANLGRTAGGGVGQIRGITSAATPAASAMSSLSGAAGLLVRTLPMVGGAVAAINLTGLISQSTQLAARYETLGVVMNVVGKNAGYTSAEMERFDKSLQKTGISMAESRNNLAKMASANIDLANATKLARIAQDAAVIGNVNSSQAFESLIYGIQSAQVEVLRTIGINVNFEQSYKKLADQLGKTSNELTEAEKTQARLNAVMEKAPSIAGAYEASMDTVGKKLGSTERLAENAKTMLGALFLPTWTAAVDAYSGALVNVNEELERIDVGKAQLLGRALADVFKQGNPAAATPGGFMFEVWLNYQNQAEAANVAVKKSFTDTWGEIERVGMNSANRFIASEDQRKATIQKANDEILESFRKLNQSQIDKLDEQRDAFLKAGVSRADADRWYAGARATIEESVTKKHSTELKKQVSDAKKARAEMLKDGKSAEDAIADYWDQHEKRRIAVIADSAAQTVKLRVDAEKEAADAATAILEKQQSEAEKVMDNIQDATADVFYDMFQDIGNGWEALWDSMKNWALRTLAELAARAATVQIVVPIMTSMTGASDITGAVNSLTGGGGGFNPSSLSSLVNPGSMLSNVPGYSTIAGILGTQLPGTALMSGGALSLAAGGTAGGSVASLAAAENLAGLTGGLSIGSALGMGGIGGLGYSLLGGSLGLPQSQYTGITSSLGGALGAWGGTALGGVIGGATAGSVVPIVGTAAGAILGGLAGGLFSEDEMSPSVIFNAQSTAWGSTDSTRRANDGGNKRLGFEFHTKDGASSSTGVELATALEGVASTAFDSIEATLSAFGDQYVDMLDGTVIEFGRKVEGAAGGAWDFGSDMDFEKLFAEYSGKLQGSILKAAEGAFNAAGRDIAGSEDATSALSMLAEKAAGQFSELQSVIQAGVQSGDVDAYAAQIQSFQAIVQSITATWDAVSQASAELINPLTQYEQAQRAVNQQYDVWIAQLEAIGFASEKVAQIEADRVTVLRNLAEENRAAIDDVLAAAASIANPVKSVEAAVDQLNAQFDALAEQLDALGASSDALRKIESDRAVSLRNLAAETTRAIDAILGQSSLLANPLNGVDAATAQANAQFDRLAAQLIDLGASAEALAQIEADRQTAIKAIADAEAQRIAEAAKAAKAAANAAAKAAASAAASAAAKALADAQDNLREAYRREAAEIEATASKWDSFARSLKKWRDDIMTGSMSPIPASSQADMVASRYQDVLNRAKLGDEDAISELQGVAGQQLTAAKDTAKTAEDYARSALRTLGEVQSVESVATRHADIARQQLEALTRQVSALITINESVLSVVDAIGALNVAKSTQRGARNVANATRRGEQNVAKATQVDAQDVAKATQVDAQTGVKVSAGDSAMVAAAKVLYQSIHGGASTAEYNRAAAAVGGDIAKALGWDGTREGADELRRVYGFSAGGMHLGGLRLVGENGPELEVTGPARIWNAEDTKALLSGRGDGTASEVRALRDDLRAIGRALAKNTADTAKLMQRWDGDGMPEVRVA